MELSNFEFVEFRKNLVLLREILKPVFLFHWKTVNPVMQILSYSELWTVKLPTKQF